MARLSITRIALLLLFAFAAVAVCVAQKSADKTINVVLKDGHQKKFPMSNVSRIEFKGSSMVVSHDGRQENIPVADIERLEFASTSSKGPALAPNFYVGKWEVGEGPHRPSFSVTLEADGKAHKSIGSEHGTWVMVDGEARISWDDGWHDVIRRTGNKYEKRAYEPGRPITGEPSNLAEARRANTETM